MRFKTISVALAILAIPMTAQAQHPHVRSGFWFNGGLGLGSFSCDGCSGYKSGGTASIALGGTLGQRTLIGGGLNVWAKQVDGADFSVSTLTAQIRFYPSATGGFYLLGGLGYGAEAISYNNVSVSESGAGAILGLGLDIRVGRNVSLSPFWYGNGVGLDSYNSGFGQLGLSITVH